MDNVYTVTNLEQIKALADPLRLRIMEVLRCGSLLTTKQIAVQLEEKPTKLYHHVELLESLGLIRLVETRQVRGIVEKYYQSVAKSIAVDPKVFAGDESLEVSNIVAHMFMSLVETIRNEVKSSLSKGLIGAEKDLDPVLIHLPLRTTKKRIEKIKRLLEAATAIAQVEADETGEENYSLVIALYPTDNPKIQD